MSVISEEDMLAGALLWWLEAEPYEEVGDTPAYPVPDYLTRVLSHRLESLGYPEDAAVLVADCERRWEVEQAEREVLSMAWAWGKCSLFDSACDAPLGDALDRLERAELGMNVQRRRRR